MREHNCSNCGESGHSIKSCKKGNKNTKFCSECNVEKLKTEYYRNKSNFDGLTSECILCVKSRKIICSAKSKLVQRRYRVEVKSIVLSHYGPFCACCGESNMGFLTLDHINNDGNKQRALYGKCSGDSLYRWLIKHDLPDNLGLRVLCWNCNSGRAYNGGICPHIITPTKRIENDFSAL